PRRGVRCRAGRRPAPVVLRWQGARCVPCGDYRPAMICARLAAPRLDGTHKRRSPQCLRGLRRIRLCTAPREARIAGLQEALIPAFTRVPRTSYCFFEIFPCGVFLTNLSDGSIWPHLRREATASCTNLSTVRVDKGESIAAAGSYVRFRKVTLAMRCRAASAGGRCRP